MDRIREDATVFKLAAVIEREHLFTPDGGQPQPQVRQTQKGAQFGLEPPEMNRRDNGLLINEVTLERGQDL